MKLTKKSVGGFLLGLVGGIGVMFLLFSDQVMLPQVSLMVPRRAPLIILFVALLAARNWYHGYSNRRKSHVVTDGASKERPKLRRIESNMGTRMLITQGTLAGWLYIFSKHEGWNTSSVGLQSEWPPWLSLAVGFSVYGYFLLLVVIVVKRLGIYERVLDNNMQVLASLWPRNLKERRFFVVGVCLLNPIVEELLFRGILVYQFSLAIESHTLPIAIGLVASLGNHAYQGRLAITTHLPFYAIVVGLLYSPLGLWGAIGFHYAGDIVPFVNLKQSLTAYRNRYRDWQYEGEMDQIS